MIVYQTFTLCINFRPDGYRAQVLDSPVGQTDPQFVMDLTQQEWAALEGDIPLDQAFLTIQEAGQRLFEVLFTGPIETCFRRSLDAVGPEGGLRISLRLDQASELAIIPWEILYDPSTRTYLALSQHTPLVRYTQLEQPQPDLPVWPPLTILALIANPQDLDALPNVEAEWRDIQTALRPLIDAGQVVLERTPSATLDGLQDRLRKSNVHVLHFIGHAVYDRDRDHGFVLLEDDDGNSRPVSAEQLRVVLGDHARLRLVYLNACEGAQSYGEDNFAGVAQELVRAGVPAVIGMLQEVEDKTAARLAGEFYEAVADGYPVDVALAEARKAIFLDDDALPWGLPVLFSRSQDNRLIATPVRARKPLTPKPIWRRFLPLAALLAVAMLLIAVTVVMPADSPFGWVQAAIDQRTCRANQAEETCILASRLAPGSGKASQQATRLLETSLRDAVEGSPFAVVRTGPVQDRQAALELARRYVSPLIVWGEVFDFNDLNAKVHLELVDRLGIAQSAELEPYRLQQFPVDSASITVGIPCEGEADCLGPESGRLAQSAPDVARLAMGLTSYALGQVEEARTELEPLAACLLADDEPACTDPALLPYLDDRARSLLLYYMGRIYGLQQDYERALLYLEAAVELAPDNPAPAIAAGWIYQQWSGDLVVPAEAEEAFAQARDQLGFACSPNDGAADAGERLYTLGVIHEMQEQWPDAQACYAMAANALTERGADPYPVLINLARVQRLGGQREAALKTIARAQELAPDLPWATLELARLNGENEAEARAHLDEALAIAPNMLQVHTTTAELCEVWGDRECAESAYQTARTLRPDYSWLLENIGEFYRRQEDWSRTESSLEKAVEHGAHNPWTYARLGFALQSQEKWREAADAYQQAVDLAYSDESVRHLFCPLSALLTSLQQDDLALLRKCVEWAENDEQRAWAEQRLQ